MADIENVIIDESSDTLPVITYENSPEISYWTAFQRISKLSLQMSASYTFSMQMVFLVFALSHLDESKENLAATSLITSLLNAIAGIGASPLFSMSLVVGKEIGELRDAENKGEPEEQLQPRREHIAAALGNGLIISAATSPFMIAAMVFSKPLLTGVLNQNNAVATLTQQFVRPYAIAIPGFMLRVCADQIMFSFSRTKAAMLIGGTNFAISMSLGSVLAFGKLGTPKMGANGILIGCILDAYLTAIGFSLYLAKSPRFKQFNFFDLLKAWQPYLDQLNNMRTLSRSILFSMTTETTMYLSTNAFAGMVGVEQQAALSAIMLFSTLTFLLQLAFGQTCAQELSREIGASHFTKASVLGKTGVMTALAYIAPVPIVLSAYPTILSDILGSNNEIIKNTLHGLAPIMFTGCVLDAARFNMLQQLCVLGDAKNASYLSSGCIALGIILSATLGLKTNMGVYGVALGYTTGIALATAILFMRWKTRIEPGAMEAHKNNPVTTTNTQNCCLKFFAQPPVPTNSVTDGDIEMHINPLQANNMAFTPAPNV